MGKRSKVPASQHHSSDDCKRIIRAAGGGSPLHSPTNPSNVATFPRLSLAREGGAAQLPPESYDVTDDPRLKQALSFEESSSSIIIPTETSIVACCERVRCDAQPPTLPPNKPTPLFYAFAISQRNS